MMQSAAVLPTESPVKSLPEILGVPLQRKTLSYSPFFSLPRPPLDDSQFGHWLADATCAAGKMVLVTERDRGEESESL